LRADRGCIANWICAASALLGQMAKSEVQPDAVKTQCKESYDPV
jgi:hypothetical protein